MPETTVTADAPGRVNLIGEHTDYNGGFVLPMAIPQRTRATVTPRRDREVHASSADPAAPSAVFTLGRERQTGGWLDYVQGVTWALRQAGLADKLGGFDLHVQSDVPLGSGLSSSAALEVSLLRALRQAFGLQFDDVQVARLGQRAENGFVGAQTGIMDQFASSLADEGGALFVDTRSLEYQRVPLPPSAEIAVVHSGVVHQHAGGEYNTRRAECEQAAALLGVRALRDLSLDDLPRIGMLPAPLDGRARHVVTENARVVQAVEALRAGQLERLGALFAASHASMRDDYAVSVPDVDLLVDLAQQELDVYGARMTGGGFGGCVVVLARAGAARAAAERAAAVYAEESGRTPAVLVPRAGATVVRWSGAT